MICFRDRLTVFQLFITCDAVCIPSITFGFACSSPFIADFRINMSCWTYYFSCFYDLLTVLTVGISAVAFFFTGSFFFIADFRMLMTCCTYFFCFFITADTTGEFFFAFFCAGCFCYDLSLIPMMFTPIHIYRWHICCCQSVQRCRQCRASFCYSCNFSIAIGGNGRIIY